MPVLDTIVLFGALDPKDNAHKESLQYLRLLENPEYYLAGFAILEYDIVLKSRGFTPRKRVTYYAVLSNDFQSLSTKTRRLSPEIMYLAAKLEEEAGLDYFDAGVAAEARMFDGQIVSKDGVFDKLAGITRIW
jgi:predicted nucleic acid-binding protein